MRDRRHKRERVLVGGRSSDESNVGLLDVLVPDERIVPEVAQDIEEGLALRGLHVRDRDAAAIHVIRLMTAVSQEQSIAISTSPGEGCIVPRSDQLAFFETEGAADGAAGPGQRGIAASEASALHSASSQPS